MDAARAIARDPAWPSATGGSSTAPGPVWRPLPRTRRGGLLRTSVALAAFGTACVTPYPVEPALRIPYEQFSERIETLCISSFNSAVEIEGEDDDRVEHLRAQYEARLTDLGFALIEKDVVDAAWKTGFTSVGDAFDPHTGQRREDRYAEAQQSARAALVDLGCDATLSTSIVVVRAPFYSYRVRWDGVSRPYDTDRTGYVGALSLHVSIRDLAGELIYFGTGGIEVLANIDGVFRPTFEGIEASRLLLNAEANRDALRYALEGLREPAVSGD